MFARSTTFHGRPDAIDAGMKFVTTEVAPMVSAIEGCRGLSALVDRATGECIVTSSWSDKAAMMASDEPLRPMRDRGRAIMGNSMQVDEWEIAAMHRTHHGERARVTWMTGDAHLIAETFRVMVLPQIEDLPGFCSASLLINWRTDLCCATTCWETTEAMRSSERAARDLRNSAARDTGGEIADVREFEVAYAHLHVPEMA